MNLRSALLGCSSGQLSRIAAAWKLAPEAGTLRRELVDLLATRIVDGVSDAATWTALSDLERAVVRLLVRAGGRHEAELLTRRLGREIDGMRDEDDASALADRAVGSLVERGLLFRVFDADEQRRGIYLILPDELLNAARRQAGEGDGAGGPEAAHPPERIARSSLGADLFVLASALRREAWSVASRDLAGRPAHSVGQILGRLRQLPTDGPGDPGRRWRFLLWLSQRAGWISRDAWPTPDDEVVERLLADLPGLPALALAAGPVSGADDRAAGPGQADPRRRQADALQLLSELDGAGWWSVAEVVGWLATELAGEVDQPVSARARTERGRLEEQLTRWLVGRWYWLGLVQWGWHGTGWALLAPTDALRSLATGRRPPPRHHRPDVE